jgi:hypothetical protein
MTYSAFASTMVLTNAAGVLTVDGTVTTIAWQNTRYANVKCNEDLQRQAELLATLCSGVEAESLAC